MHPIGDAVKGRPCLSPSARIENGDQLRGLPAVGLGSERLKRVSAPEVTDMMAVPAGNHCSLRFIGK
jgi:hypothetical protein